MDHIFCPACGARNAIGYKFCVKCGTDISGIEVPGGNTQAEEKTEVLQPMQDQQQAAPAANPVPETAPQPVPNPQPAQQSAPQPAPTSQQAPNYEKTEVLVNVNDKKSNFSLQSLFGNKAVLIGAGVLALVLVTLGVFRLGSLIGGKGGAGKIGGKVTTISAQDIINSETEPEFNVPYINTSNGMVTIEGYCNEFLYGEYESKELDAPYNYKNGSNEKEFKSFTKGVENIKLFDVNNSISEYEHDEICTHSAIPIKIQAFHNGTSSLNYHWWDEGVFRGNVPIGGAPLGGVTYEGYENVTDYDGYLEYAESELKELVPGNEVLYELFSRLCNYNNVNASVSQEDINTLYEKYKLNEWDLIKLTFPVIEGKTINYPTKMGYYKISGNRLLVLLVYANKNAGYGFTPIEYAIDFDENDDLLITYGDQTRTLKNYTEPDRVLGACASGKRYQDISQIQLSYINEGVVKIEDKDFLEAKARLESMTDNSISFSWDAGNDEYSIPTAGSASFKLHLVENCYKYGMPGMIIMDGNTKYFYLADFFDYWQQSLDAILGDADVDVESLSESQVKELTNVKESIGEEMERLLSSSSISSDAYTIDEESGKIIFNEGILFDTGKSELKPGAYDVINAFSQIYNELYRSYGDKISYISVEGYADSTGSDAINIPLSQARAEAVANAMNTSCERKAQGFGSSKLIINEDGTENREASRRVELKIILKVE